MVSSRVAVAAVLGPQSRAALVVELPADFSPLLEDGIVELVDLTCRLFLVVVAATEAAAPVVRIAGFFRALFDTLLLLWLLLLLLLFLLA